MDVSKRIPRLPRAKEILSELKERRITLKARDLFVIGDGERSPKNGKRESSFIKKAFLITPAAEDFSTKP